MASGMRLDDDFRVLGLKPAAQPSEVKQAYRRLVKKWHPDRHHSESYESRALAEEKFRQIDNAYRRISKTWVETTPLRRPAPMDLDAARPSVPKHRAAFHFPHRPFSARSFSTAPAIRPAALSLAAAVFLLVLFLPPLSTITPDLPIAIHGKPRRTSPTGERYAGRPRQTLLRPPTPSPATPKPQAASPLRFFTLGSSYSDVLHVQGRPTRIQGDTWIYGVSEIDFRNARVCGYNNFDGSLRVKMAPASRKNRLNDYITIGSTRRQVLLVQGTPSRIQGNHWYYGFAELTFQNGLVSGYDNYFGTLKIRLRPSAQINRGQQARFFTKGSTPDQVLAVQGVPTAIHRNRWTYNFDYVFFRNGKVSAVINADEALLYADPQKQGVAERP